MEYGVAKTTDQAIAATRGMVLTSNQELVDALYSSTTGGVTASLTNVWNSEDRPYLGPLNRCRCEYLELLGKKFSR
jgi:SpoIID/LytB domain protein